RLVLRRLHVRLVERVDSEDRAGDRDRELPTEELGAELVGLSELDVGTLAVGPGRALAGRRHEALALLAGRLRDQLLGPEAEPAFGLRDADLVPTLPPPLAELEPELEARVELAAAALRHAHCVLEQPLQVDIHQRRSDQAE